jgi:hypothetical protein
MKTVENFLLLSFLNSRPHIAIPTTFARRKSKGEKQKACDRRVTQHMWWRERSSRTADTVAMVEQYRVEAINLYIETLEKRYQEIKTKYQIVGTELGDHRREGVQANFETLE